MVTISLSIKDIDTGPMDYRSVLRYSKGGVGMVSPGYGPGN